MQTSEVRILHRAQYYETDSMRIVHHSNYVRWMEEARLEYLRQAGFPWSRLEQELGLMIPVLFESVDYKHMIRFDEEIVITCRMTAFNGVKMNFEYEFRDRESNTLRALGVTRHGFLDREYHPVALQAAARDAYEALQGAFET